jgi:hypothetical protein
MSINVYNEHKKNKLNKSSIKAGSSSMNNLGLHYKNIENYAKMNEYLLMGVENNNVKSMNNLNIHYMKNEFVFYDLLKTIKNKNRLITDKIIELEQKKCMITYKNKIRLFTKLNNKHTCDICYEEDVLNIDLNCGHEVCIECYKIMKKCHYRCLTNRE